MSLNSTTFDVLRERALAAATPEDFLDLLFDLAAATDALKAAKAVIHDAVGEHIEEHGDLVYVEQPGKVGPRDCRWYVGPVSEVKPRSSEPGAKAALFEDALALVGGDLTELAELLSSGWMKQGALNQLDEETWARHFKRHEKTELKDGKPKKVHRLQEVRVAFAGPKGGGRG